MSLESPLPRLTHREGADDPLPYKTAPRLHSLETDTMDFGPPGKLRYNSGGYDQLAPNDRSLDDENDFTIEGETENATETNLGSSLESLHESFITGDQTNGFPAEVLANIGNPTVEEDSPAAEALRANAEVHVRPIEKFARKMHVPGLRRMLKRNKRGKPPNLPPHRITDDGAIYAVDEEKDGSDDDLKSGLHSVHSKASSNSDFVVDVIPMEEEKKKAVKFEDTGKVPTEITANAMETGRKLLTLSDPHDILETQRWRRRRKRGAGKDARKSYVKGKVIDGQHESYALSIAVMLGVRTSIGTTNTQMNGEMRRWLTSDDFMATEKYEFKPSGGPRTPPHQLGHTFKFKDYSPVAFAYLRRLFGINEFDFLLSVCGNANFIEFISNAKSGQFFFYSSDGRFMIKTMTNAESKFLRRILPHYFRHCSQNPNTLITKFLGMYRVKLYHLRRNVKFVIMNSVYCTDKLLQNFYDLKGSVTGRDAKPHHDVKKDNDLRRNLPDGALAMEPVTRERVRAQIYADCEFMRRMKIMDYSMLVGVHHIPVKGSKGVDKRSLLRDTRKSESVKLMELLSSAKSLKNPAISLSEPPLPKVGFERSELEMSTQSLPQNTGQTPAKRELKRVGVSTPAILSTPQLEKAVLESEKQRPIRFGLMDGVLDDDDDNSYLEGSANYEKNAKRGSTSFMEANADNIEELEVKKEHTIEQVYWPFHRFHDIHGHRRMVPRRCRTYGENSPTEMQELEELQGVNVPSFITPISDRKDNGIEMDTTGFPMPLKFKTVKGVEHFCEGKIFYMGIIDVLQQYNLRKRLEARYRRARGSGWQDASCVHPDIYAERFLRFFDEYSTRDPATNPLRLEEGEEGIIFSKEKEESKEEEELRQNLSGIVGEGLEAVEE